MNQSALVTGSHSQLARCMAMADSPPGWRGNFWPRGELDITDTQQLEAVLTETNPNCVINTAAYTAVDRAESEADQAWRVNAEGVANLADWCAAHGARLIHISTDFVFDGRGKTPYSPEAEPAPLGAYGASKLAGEREVVKLPPGQGIIVRTSWLYSEFGNNFVKTMLKLLAERDELSVVGDQTGCPTSAHSLAALVWKIVCVPARSGLYHWHDGGEMSWFEFAREIQQLGTAAGALSRKIPLQPIAAAAYPTAAVRPAYSAMDRSRTLEHYGMPERDWRAELIRVVSALAGRSAGQ